MSASKQQPEQTIAEFIAGLTYEDMPNELVRLGERAFVDTVGVTLAGVVTDAGEHAAAFAERLSGAADGASLLGRASRASLPAAVLANGTAGHALDYDDLSWGMDGHPSVPLVAPALAVGEHVDADGAAVVTAYAAGFETMCYLAEPITPHHYELGWHATATFGTFGATAAACSLLDLDAEATRRALAVAASMPAGLKRNFGSMTKPLHAGLAGRSGVTAALLAADGFTADDYAVSGERGFWEVYAEGADHVPDPPGAPWRLREHGINVKNYPCCYFTHTAIAATQALAAEADLSPADVESIYVTAAPGAGDALAHADPETGLEAKFSMEYCVAVALARDRVGLAAFEDENVDDPAVQAVRERVTFEVDPNLEYDSHEATIRIRTTDGRDLERTQYDPPGTYKNPLSDAELEAKFTECATHALTEDEVAAVHDSLASLADQESVAVVLEPL